MILACARGGGRETPNETLARIPTVEKKKKKKTSEKYDHRIACARLVSLALAGGERERERERERGDSGPEKYRTQERNVTEEKKQKAYTV